MQRLLIGAVLALGLAPAAFAAVNCASFPNQTINQFVNDDVIAVNVSCTIGPMGTVNGNIEQQGDGGITVRGRVNGGISEQGPGDILIARGAVVGGDVSEADGGNVSIRGGASLSGVIEEAGDGSVNATVDVPGLDKGDIYANGNGGVTINAQAGSYERSSSRPVPATSTSSCRQASRSRATSRSRTAAASAPRCTASSRATSPSAWAAT